MKKIVLKQFLKTASGYQVNLGNGTVHVFPSLRLAKAFLNKTNQFLTERAFAIHSIYMALWQEYQRVWFYYGFGSKYSYTSHTLDQKKCADELQSAESAILMAFNASDATNGSHISFRQLRIAITCLKASIKILMPLFRLRSQTADLYRLENYFAQLIDIENKLNSYAQLQATAHIINRNNNNNPLNQSA